MAQGTWVARWVEVRDLPEWRNGGGRPPDSARWIWGPSRRRAMEVGAISARLLRTRQGRRAQPPRRLNSSPTDCSIPPPRAPIGRDGSLEPDWDELLCDVHSSFVPCYNGSTTRLGADDLLWQLHLLIFPHDAATATPTNFHGQSLSLGLLWKLSSIAMVLGDATARFRCGPK